MKLIVLVASLGLALAQVEVNSPCPIQVAVSNFSLQQFAGHWFEVKRYQKTEKTNSSVTDCVALNLTSNSTTFANLTDFYKVLPQKMRQSKNGSLWLPDEPTTGHLRVQRNNSEPTDYLVLSTDYSNYAVVWSCEDILGTNRSNQLVQVLSRNAALPKSTMDKLQSLYESLHVDKMLFRETNQSDSECKNSAVPATGASILMVGVFVLAQIWKN